MWENGTVFGGLINEAGSTKLKENIMAGLTRRVKQLLHPVLYQNSNAPHAASRW